MAHKCPCPQMQPSHFSQRNTASFSPLTRNAGKKSHISFANARQRFVLDRCALFQERPVGLDGRSGTGRALRKQPADMTSSDSVSAHLQRHTSSVTCRQHAVAQSRNRLHHTISSFFLIAAASWLRSLPPYAPKTPIEHALATLTKRGRHLRISSLMPCAQPQAGLGKYRKRHAMSGNLLLREQHFRHPVHSA